MAEDTLLGCAGMILDFHDRVRDSADQQADQTITPRLAPLRASYLPL
jgi:hypothetical protein